ncbi:MAG: DUF6782 family putative metallopeptidase [Geminicoccaceae bacterium]
MQRIQALIPDWRHRCVTIDDEDSVNPEKQALQKATADLRKSHLGNWLVDHAADLSVLLCLDSGTDLEAYYRAHLHLIGLNTRLDAAGRLVFLAHELAHVPQHPRFSNNRLFSPEDMLLLHRAREASAEAVATRVLWQLRELGIDEPWRAKLDTAYGDIAQLFETNMHAADSDDAELWATRSAFHQWFEVDWRLDIYDDLMLKTLARIAGDHIGMLPPSKWLSDSYLRDMSRYAGQRFLIEGDGQALMGAFGISWSASGNQARLDAILRQGRPGHGKATFGVRNLGEGTGLSASSSRPINIDPVQQNAGHR